MEIQMIMVMGATGVLQLPMMIMVMTNARIISITIMIMVNQKERAVGMVFLAPTRIRIHPMIV